LGAVLNTIYSLSRAMENNPNYKGKLIKRSNAAEPDLSVTTSTEPKSREGRSRKSGSTTYDTQEPTLRSKRLKSKETLLEVLSESSSDSQSDHQTTPDEEDQIEEVPEDFFADYTVLLQLQPKPGPNHILCFVYFFGSVILGVSIASGYLFINSKRSKS